MENSPMELRMDGDLQSVAEFMQSNIPASKLMTVAEDLPKIGRLLWAQHSQEPSLGLMLLESQPTSDSLTSASESSLEMVCAGDGSGAGA
jgi:hypothetical protein